MKNIVILGRGRSGEAARKLAEFDHLRPRLLADGDDFAGALADADLIVTSPGMKPESPLYRAACAAAAARGIELIGEMEFAFRRHPVRLLAVTGTDGKTTTTELTVALLRAAGVAAEPAGNIGVPLSEVAARMLSGELPPETLPVVETSSFQLEHVDRFAPLAAVLLNVGDDHLDRYGGDPARYAEVKRRIFRHVAPENRIFGLSMDVADFRRRVTADGTRIALDGAPLLDCAGTPLAAPHNRENLCAALELAVRAVAPETLRRTAPAAVAAFRPGRHRIEPVGEWRGVRFVNDSKATNPHAAAAALTTLNGGGVRLLLGGLDKGMDFRTLRAFAPKIRKAYLFGACRAKIAAALDGAVECADFGGDFEAAVRAAAGEAEPGETVLLAPACASMDMFRDYQERGDRFRRAVAAWIAADGAAGGR